VAFRRRLSTKKGRNFLQRQNTDLAASSFPFCTSSYTVYTPAFALFDKELYSFFYFASALNFVWRLTSFYFLREGLMTALAIRVLSYVCFVGRCTC
jgi:hypothetical protein